MPGKMKVAVFHNLPSGGAKRALFESVKYLSQKGNQIDVYIPETANEDFLPLSTVGGNLHVIPIQKTFLSSIWYRILNPASTRDVNLKNLENTHKKIAEIIDSKDYDLVFCEQDKYTLGPYFLKYIKKPVIYYCQQTPRKEEILKNISSLNGSEKRPLKNKIFSFLYKRAEIKELEVDKHNSSFAQYVLANSYFSRESILRTYGLNAYVSYLGVDIKIFKPLNIPKSDFVLSVGTCTPSKGYEFVIRSLSLLDEEIRPKFIIVSNSGDPVWEEYLIELAGDLSVELDILKLIDDDKLVELYNTAKIIVYAPYLEPFGLVPIESMACGTPVVGVKEGGVRETVIHNHTGLLTERDESLFSKAILDLLQDDEKLSRMSKESIKYVLQFWTTEKAGERLENHLYKFIGKE